MNRYLKYMLIFLVPTFFWACGSDTNSEGDNGLESIYVAEEGESGTFSMRVSRPSANVGDTISFFVSARDRNGGPVPSMSVSCASEAGLSVVEPVEGVGLTNDNGDLSGSVACVLDGSWRLLCRAISAGWEEHRTIKCE